MQFQKLHNSIIESKPNHNNQNIHFRAEKKI